MATRRRWLLELSVAVGAVVLLFAGLLDRRACREDLSRRREQALLAETGDHLAVKLNHFEERLPIMSLVNGTREQVGVVGYVHGEPTFDLQRWTGTDWVAERTRWCGTGLSCFGLPPGEVRTFSANSTFVPFNQTDSRPFRVRLRLESFGRFPPAWLYSDRIEMPPATDKQP